MNPCDDFSICMMNENNEEGFSCPCNEHEGEINRIGDGRKSGPGCVCPDGYQGDGDGKCVDHDECVSFEHDCHQMAKCLNTDGSFECSCIDGYEGNGPY